MSEDRLLTPAITGTLLALGTEVGGVRMESCYDTDPDDLWSALTDRERLSAWVAQGEGDLRLGGAFAATFTSGWREGPGRVDVCDPPHHCC